MSTAPSGPLTMHIGRRRYPVASLEAASRMFCAARDRAATGASETPTALLISGGEVVAHVSYNGRVWPGLPQDWKPGVKPLLEPVGR